MVYLFLALGIVSLIVFLVLRDNKGSAIAITFKTLTSVFFIATAIAAFYTNFRQSAFSIENIDMFLLFLGGLIFGLIGDILLDCKILYPQDDAPYTYAGMASFAVGHVLYISAIAMYFGGFNWWGFLVGIVLAAAFMCVSIFVMKMDFGKYLIPTILYSVLLIGFMCQSFCACINDGWSGVTVLIFVASIVFLLSDVVLSMTYFEGKDSKAMIIVNHVLYYAAQFMLAMSLLIL